MKMPCMVRDILKSLMALKLLSPTMGGQLGVHREGLQIGCGEQRCLYSCS